MSDFLIESKNLSFKYKNESYDALHDITFGIAKGEFVSVVGANGSGKSTLINLLCGFLKPHKGEVLLEGSNVSSLSSLQKAKIVSLVTQKQEMNFSFSCMEMVLMGLSSQMSLLEKTTDDHLLKAKDIMVKTGVWNLASKAVTDISGGELQRVILSRALVSSPSLLILDEAMSETDIFARYNMMKLIKQISRERKMAVVCVNHDLTTSFKFSDKILALKKGEQFCFQKPQSLLNQDFFKEVFSVSVNIYDNGTFVINDSI